MRSINIYVFIFISVIISLSACSTDELVKEGSIDIAIIGGERQDLKLGGTLTLKADINEDVFTNYEWVFEGEILSTDIACDFYIDKVGTYQVSLVAYANHKKTTSFVNITVYEPFDSVTNIKDIKKWIGEGENISILAIQWIQGSEWESPREDNVHFLCWGYKWKSEEAPTGHDMILEVAKNDPRFFVFVGPGFAGIDSPSIRGFGYDASGDGQFSIKNDRTSKVYTQRDFTDGVIEIDGGIDSGDGYLSIDPADYWQGGWKENYCSYYLGEDKLKVPTIFNYSGLMAGLRVLSNGSWDVWTFSKINAGETNTYPFSEWMVSAIGN